MHTPSLPFIYDLDSALNDTKHVFIADLPQFQWQQIRARFLI
ncbi:hypothetical protein [Scytonema millei]|nr:hypothetical protein [Scytonema millei]